MLRSFLSTCRQFGFRLELLGQTLLRAPSTWKRRAMVADQLFVGGVQVVHVVLLVGLFAGMILALQTGLYLAQLGQQDQIGTIVALAMAREMGPFITGVILAATAGSALAAELHGLTVLAHAHDSSDNATRFVILALEDAPRSGRDKTSLVFSTLHERGALRRALEAFDAENINLTRIESRPARGRRWEYVFFTDLEGHRLDEPVQRALSRLATLCSRVEVLGSYPRAE